MFLCHLQKCQYIYIYIYIIYISKKDIKNVYIKYIYIYQRRISDYFNHLKYFCENIYVF